MKTIETIEKVTVTETVTLTGVVTDGPPLRVSPRLRAAPKIRQMYWCDFPKDAQLPEFWKCRAVIVVSFKNTLYGAVTIIPCSSDPQDWNEWAYKQTTTIDGRPESWAICDKPTTVAVSRLSPDKSGVKFIPEAEFNAILALMLNWLPKVRA